MVAILSKFTILYLVIYSLKLKLIFFYNRVAYTRIFLILLSHPARFPRVLMLNEMQTATSISYDEYHYKLLPQVT